MGINLSVPRGLDPQLKPRITVIGVGGAGGNAVNNMISKNLEGVDFIVANTDAQALAQASTERRIQLGVHTTEGLGAGARPEVGRAAAEETMETIQGELAGSHMAFITAGMGGGTGTGAAPVVARAAREMGILTVGVVTKPFHFEGIHRMRIAEAGMEELARYVDTLIIIPNQNLFRVANERTTFAQAFNMADDVLYAGVRGVTDLMLMPGLINLDFADIRTVMSEMGKAMMGTGEAEGEKRALEAAEAAISNPLLDDTSMKGARGVLINITGGPDMTLYEVDEAANRIRDEVDPDANIIFGSTFDARLEGKVRVSVVATGIDAASGVQPRPGNHEVAAREQPRQPPALPTFPGRGGNDMPLARSPYGQPGQLGVAAQLNNPMSAGANALAGSTAMVADADSSYGSARNSHDLAQAALAEAHAAADAAEARATKPADRQYGAPGDRPQQPAGRPGMRTDAFIPAPPMDPKDMGARGGQGRPGMAPNAGVNPRAGLPPAGNPGAGLNGAYGVQTPGPAPSSLAPRPPQPPVHPQPQAQPMQPQPAVLTNPEPPARRPQTLLEKVAGIGRIRRAVEPPRPEAREQPRQPADAPSLKVEPDDRPVSSPVEDDLDIPAFLRRQAN